MVNDEPRQDCSQATELLKEALDREHQKAKDLSQARTCDMI